MPRPNRPRSVLAERNVAANVARLRAEHDPPWSIEGVAERMAQAGCPIHPSALYKLEKGDPPRRVTVDELVAFSIVFGLPIAELIRNPADRIPEQFVNLQERLLLQIGLRHALQEIEKEIAAGQRQIEDEWTALIEKTPVEHQPQGRVRPIGIDDAPHEAVEWQLAHARYEREAYDVIRKAIMTMESRSVGGDR